MAFRYVILGIKTEAERARTKEASSAEPPHTKNKDGGGKPEAGIPAWFCLDSNSYINTLLKYPAIHQIREKISHKREFLDFLHCFYGIPFYTITYWLALLRVYNNHQGVNMKKTLYGLFFLALLILTGCPTTTDSTPTERRDQKHRRNPNLLTCRWKFYCYTRGNNNQ